MTPVRLVTGEQLPRVLAVRSVPFAASAGVLALVMLTTRGGTPALVGSLLGLSICASFYGLDVAALALSRRLRAAASLPLFLIEYLLKTAVAATVLWLLRDATWLDMRAMAVTVVAVVAVGVVALTVAALRTRSFALDQ